MIVKDKVRTLRGRFFDILAKLGEWLEDDGNGGIQVTTHAGLRVRIQVWNHAPTSEVRTRLVRLSILPEVRRYNGSSVDRYLVRNGYVTKTATQRLKLTKRGRIAARRFDLLDRRDIVRERLADANKKARRR